MWILVFSHFAFAETNTCPLQTQPISEERRDITVEDIAPLVKQAKGCVTLIELWASWCGPCVQIAPEVQALHESFPNLPIISISADATTVAAEKFWKTHPSIGQKYRLSSWTMPTLQSVYGEMGGTFPGAIPYFVVLNTDGTVYFETHEPQNLDTLRQKILEITPKQEAAQ